MKIAFVTLALLILVGLIEFKPKKVVDPWVVTVPKAAVLHVFPRYAATVEGVADVDITDYHTIIVYIKNDISDEAMRMLEDTVRDLKLKECGKEVVYAIDE